MKRKTVQAHVLDREALDQHLASEAQQAGVTIATGMDIRSVEWKGTASSSWRVLKTAPSE